MTLSKREALAELVSMVMLTGNRRWTPHEIARATELTELLEVAVDTSSPSRK